MISFIIHGDNHLSSRQELTSLITRMKSAGTKDIITLSADKLTLEQLTPALESQSFFGTNKLVIIENLLSAIRSKEKNNLINYLSSTDHQASIILWEKKLISTAILKKLAKFKVSLHKTKAAIFQFLDSLSPGKSPVFLKILHTKLTKEPIELVFYFLHRRICQLIIAKDPQADKLLTGAPWQKTKLKSQSSKFDQKKLINLHSQLLNIDYSIKSGRALMPLSSQLDFLLMKI